MNKTNQTCQLLSAKIVRGTAQSHKPNKIQHDISLAVSRERLRLGEFLLQLQAPLKDDQRQAQWKLFEDRLREYLDLLDFEVDR